MQNVFLIYPRDKFLRYLEQRFLNIFHEYRNVS